MSVIDRFLMGGVGTAPTIEETVTPVIPVPFITPSTLPPPPPAKKTGGGITVKPWWTSLPETPIEAIESTLATPTISPVGLFKSPAQVGTKAVVKLGLLGAVAGFIGGLLFGGGGGQEQAQDQDLDITPTVIPTQTITPFQEMLLKILTSQKSQADISDTSLTDTAIYGGGGGVRVASPSQITQSYANPITYNIQKTISNQITKTLTYSYAGQEATQEQGMGLLEMALIGGVVLGSVYLFRR